MTDDTTAINQIIDWLEQLSQQQGYDEARQLRRDIIDATGPDGVSWNGLTDAMIADALNTWLVRSRMGGAGLPPMPPAHMDDCTREIKAALAQHATDTNRPATLSVEEFGDALQGLWVALRGPDEAETPPAPEVPNGHGLRTDFKLGR